MTKRVSRAVNTLLKISVPIQNYGLDLSVGSGVVSVAEGKERRERKRKRGRVHTNDTPGGQIKVVPGSRSVVVIPKTIAGRPSAVCVIKRTYPFDGNCNKISESFEVVFFGLTRSVLAPTLAPLSIGGPDNVQAQRS